MLSGEIDDGAESSPRPGQTSMRDCQQGSFVRQDHGDNGYLLGHTKHTDVGQVLAVNEGPAERDTEALTPARNS